jgi:hypothetical protein
MENVIRVATKYAGYSIPKSDELDVMHSTIFASPAMLEAEKVYFSALLLLCV